MQKIKINIANRTYPLSVEEHQEETVRKSAKKINDAINNYEEKYAVQDKQDSLAMYALQITSQSQDLTNKKEEDMSKINIELNEINNMISEADIGTKISISGGLEPLTNPKLGSIIKTGSDRGFKLPLITNAYSLTDSFVKKNPEIWLLDSLRISLYGHDDQSYKDITQLDKSFKSIQHFLS